MKISNIKFIKKAYTYWKYRPKKEIKEIFKKFPENFETPETNIKYKKILFCPFAPHQINIIREGIWAHACRIRGATVKMITYDLFLKTVDFLSVKVQKDLSASYAITKNLYEIMKLPAIFMSRYYNPEKKYPFDFNKLKHTDIQDFIYKDIFLGDLIIASTVHYFLCNEPEWDNPEFLNKAREFAHTAVVLTDIYQAIFDAEKPDKIVTSHGIYVAWGTLFRVARKNNIPVDVYGASYRKHTLRFYHNAPNAPFPVALWEKYKDIPLSDEQTKIVEKYFASRSTQKEDNISLFSEESNFPENLKNFISEAKNNKQKIFGLFTNISWDAFMFSSDNQIFSSMVEWLTETIKFFKENSQAKIIIKAHPAELFFKVPKKYHVKNLLPENLPENIYFIDNNAGIKPFDLYEYFDAGLIYLSTVALEMALLNIPVITAGDISQYSNKNFTIDPKTKQEYFEIIKKFINDEINFEPDIQMAQRYMYYRFFREALYFDIVETQNYKVKKIHINSPEDLQTGKNKTLDIICNGILNDADFINNK